MNVKGNLANVEVDNSIQSKRDSSTSNPSIAPSAESNVEAMKTTKYISLSSRKKVTQFNLWTKPDGSDVNSSKNRTWFHFSIEKEMDEKSDLLINIRFSLMSLNSVKKLFEMGMRPVYRLSGHEDWNRIPNVPTVESIDHGMKLHFNVYFSRTSSDEYDVKDLDYKTLGSRANPFPLKKIYFAYSIPYTYTYLQQRLTALENHFAPSFMKRTDLKSPSEKSNVANDFNSKYHLVNRAGHETNIYFHRDLLAKSLDGHRLDLITISSLDGMVDNPTQEDLASELFPDGPKSRSRIFRMCPNGLSLSSLSLGGSHLGAEGKKYFIVSARVHPGETFSSFVLDGFLDFILCEHDPRAALLRSKFVFKIIPMLNPDGCYRGNYRDDSRGVNLNRVYDYPDPNLHPTIYAVKKYIGEIFHKSGEIGFYIDLHAHANKTGCFLFANRVLDSEDRKKIWTFGKRMKEHCMWFDLRECDFSADNNVTHSLKALNSKNSICGIKSSPDQKEHRTKDGTGRVAVFAATGCPHCYTFEVNYHGARRDLGWSTSALSQKVNTSSPYCPPIIKCKTDTCILNQSIASFSKQEFQSDRNSGFTLGDLHSMGRSIALAALDVFAG